MSDMVVFVQDGWKQMVATAKVKEALSKAAKLKVTGPASCEDAQAVARECSEYIKRIELEGDAVADPIYRQWKLLKSEIKKYTAPFLAAKERLGQQIEQWNRERLEIRRSEEARLAREQAELQRKTEEAKAKADAEAALQVEAHQVGMPGVGEPEPATLDEQTVIPGSETFVQPRLGSSPAAVPARAESAEEEALRLKKAELAVQQMRLQAVQKEGVRTTWKYRVVDLAKVPKEYLVLDDAKVRADVAKGFRFIEGLEIYEDVSAVIR